MIQNDKYTYLKKIQFLNFSTTPVVDLSIQERDHNGLEFPAQVPLPPQARSLTDKMPNCLPYSGLPREEWTEYAP